MANAMGFGPFVIDIPRVGARVRGCARIIPHPFATLQPSTPPMSADRCSCGAIPPSPRPPPLPRTALALQVLMNSNLRWMDNMVNAPSPYRRAAAVSMKNGSYAKTSRSSIPYSWRPVLCRLRRSRLPHGVGWSDTASSSNLMYTVYHSPGSASSAAAKTVYDGVSG